MSSSVRMCKVVITIESDVVSCNGKWSVHSFYVDLPAKDEVDYEESALKALEWFDKIVDAKIDYSVEVCPPFTIVHGMRLV